MDEGSKQLLVLSMLGLVLAFLSLLIGVLMSVQASLLNMNSAPVVFSIILEFLMFILMVSGISTALGNKDNEKIVTNEDFKILTKRVK